MTKNLDATLRAVTGEPLKDETGKPVTLKTVIVNAVLAPDPGQDGEALLKRFALAERVHAGGDQEFTPEELAIIKERVVKLFASPTIVGPVWNWANG